MLSTPSQLVPGCILLKDIYGKSNRPIIYKHTILTEQHIEFLKAFLVESVEVDPNLSNGKVFEPKLVDEQVGRISPNSVEDQNGISTFKQHFQKAVKDYKKLYKTIQSGIPLDILKVRQIIIPLLERVDEIDENVTRLHHYGEKRDYLFFHSIALGILSSYLARKLGFSKGEWLQIGIAGLLSDSGMAKINSNIILKDAPLLESELEEIKKHPTYSYRLVEHISALTVGVKLAVLQHHERLDGSGYPLGVPMDKIHKYAQIVAVCDTYHAMTSERLYKEKKSPYKVIEEIQKNQYTKFNPEIVKVFAKSLANFSVGTKILLNNKQQGEVIFVEPANPTRPIIRLEHNGDIIALQTAPNLHIEQKI
ncbi:HD-GYP domain-containing protein [Oceanobacillus halophilus]|uniref:HD-GYP domain-containing protein n=1 Tax=Oceanobacillus halophilus TaxID=930130 RepID=A0A495A1R6_9BACI|nr:HD-GYP domain-containing protein [Oceanobacillus halophilus]RKQ32985.1 HD-GYP domain-containing protein [Oceanobacillus halophilus]